MYGLENKPKHGKSPSNWGLKGDHYIWTSSVLGFVQPSYDKILITYSHERGLGLYRVTLDSGKVKRGESLSIRDVQVRPRLADTVGGQADYLVAHPVQLVVAAPAQLKLLKEVPCEREWRRTFHTFLLT